MKTGYVSVVKLLLDQELVIEPRSRLFLRRRDLSNKQIRIEGPKLFSEETIECRISSRRKFIVKGVQVRVCATDNETLSFQKRTLIKPSRKIRATSDNVIWQ